MHLCLGRGTRDDGVWRPLTRGQAWRVGASAAAFAILVALGTWQLHRLTWKRGILERIAAAEAGPPVPLGASPAPFTKVFAEGTYRAGASVLYGSDVRDTAAGPRLGAFLVTPLARNGMPDVLVQRGWVPTDPVPPDTAAGRVSVEGYVRGGDSGGWFSAPDDPDHRRFYTLNPRAIAAAVGVTDPADIILVAIGPAGAPPIPAETLPRPPNDHLGYALTWYGLAACVVVVSALSLRSHRRTA